jgi:hypothetical protein
MDGGRLLPKEATDRIGKPFYFAPRMRGESFTVQSLLRRGGDKIFAGKREAFIDRPLRLVCKNTTPYPEQPGQIYACC